MSDFLSEAEAVAIKAAKEAGKIALKHFRKKLSVEFKGANVRNLVTNADKEADAVIRKTILTRFPDHGIVTEEAKPQKGNDYVWYIDPIDGTTNYSRGSNYFCISIALANGNDLLVGIIYNPVLLELYTAVKGRGAFLNGKKISTAPVTDLRHAMVCCDMGYEDEERIVMSKLISNIAVAVKSVRVKGSGAMAMCELALGTVDCYLDTSSYPWDYAATALLIREAGGKVTELDNGEWKPYSRGVLAASNEKLHQELFKKVRVMLK